MKSQEEETDQNFDRNTGQAFFQPQINISKLNRDPNKISDNLFKEHFKRQQKMQKQHETSHEKMKECQRLKINKSSDRMVSAVRRQRLE